MDAVTAAAVLAESQALRRTLSRYRTHCAWQAAAEASALRARVQQLLAPVRRWTATATVVPTAPTLRVAHWNVLHGNQYERIRAALQHEPPLAGVDLLALNEVDWGMARSGNRDVAFDLARALGMHAAWAALFLELEGGSDTPPELAVAEQAEALFGLALLSRFPLGSVQRVPLDTDAEFLFDVERKVGGLVALVVEVQRPGAPFHAIVTHLDVHRGPATRARQMAQVLAHVPPGAAVLCGDLNTTTFARGNALRAARALGVLALAPPRRLRQRLLQPYEPQRRPREPLFAALSAAGFMVAPFNAVLPSLDLHLEEVREYAALPAGVRWIGQRLLRRAERRGRHRLDWIAARGFDPAPERPPFTLCHLMRGAPPLSDHAPIGCGLRTAVQ